MRRVYVLCFLILTVVVLDILLFHTGAARAQQSGFSGFRVDRVSFRRTGPDSGTAPTYGTVVGFDCVNIDGRVECFVASKIN